MESPLLAVNSPIASEGAGRSMRSLGTISFEQMEGPAVATGDGRHRQQQSPIQAISAAAGSDISQQQPFYDAYSPPTAALLRCLLSNRKRRNGFVKMGQRGTRRRTSRIGCWESPDRNWAEEMRTKKSSKKSVKAKCFVFKMAAASLSRPASSVQRGDIAQIPCFLTSAIPPELRMHIYSYVPPVDVDRGLALTCKMLRHETVSSSNLWKDFCERSGKLELPLKVSTEKPSAPCEHGCNSFQNTNPYITHYHHIPSVPLDFPSVDAALLAVMEKKAPKKQRNQGSKVLVEKYIAGKAKVHLPRHVPNPSPKAKISYVRGVYVSQDLAKKYWMQDRTQLEELVRMHSCLLRLEMPDDCEDDEDGVWMHCYMF